MRELLDAIIGGGIVGIIFGAIVKGYVSRVFKRQENMEDDLKSLKENRIKLIEEDLKAHIKEDKSQKILNSLETLTGSVSRLNDKLDRFSEETCKQSSEISSNRKYIENLDHSFEKHKQNHLPYIHNNG